MQGWLRSIQDWLWSDDLEQRPVSEHRQRGAGFMLEQRLVLGALTPGVVASDSAAGWAGTSAGQDSETASQSLTVPAASDSTGQTLLIFSVTPDQSSEGLVTAGETILSPLFVPTFPLDDASFDLSPLSPAPLAEERSFSTPPLTTQTTEAVSASALGTDSSPLKTAQPAEVIGPPTAIDSSLTAVNTQVFLTKEQVDAGVRNMSASDEAIVPAWYSHPASTMVIRYDFRDEQGVANEITAEQIETAQTVLAAWTAASGGRIQWVRDTQADAADIVNIGVGDMAAMELNQSTDHVLGSSRHFPGTEANGAAITGTVWLNDQAQWTGSTTGDNSRDSVDFATVLAHETGHIIGLEDDPSSVGVMNSTYSGPIDLGTLASALSQPNFFSSSDVGADGFIVDNMTGFPQLSQADVATLLQRASLATPSNDAIIAIVDRNGTILGVRAEQDVLNTIVDPATLAFAVDGAVSKARTAAFFANNTAPLTSRTVRNLSQTTILQREVEANPNSADPTVQGPGFVAPIGIGGHFPADISHTPPVDLFAIEHTNRDSSTLPGLGRFNVDPANIPAGQELVTPISYGTDAGIPGATQNRGIATLPGGIPIYRDTNSDGIGDTLVGGIGVFFPGADGFATHEQGFVANQGQTSKQRTNSDRSLEAEFIAFAALGGSQLATENGVVFAEPGTFGGVDAVPDIDLPFGFLSLVGINLEVFGSTPGTKGVQDLVDQFQDVAGTGTDSGANLALGGGVFTREGNSVPEGYLVAPHTSVNSGLTVDDMTQIIDAGIAAANEVRAAIRLGADLQTGADGVRMTFAITDTQGDILALFRMQDGTVFSIDVAVAKARNVAYYADPAQLQVQDQVETSDGGPLVAAGTAFSNRTFRFLAEPRFPSGVDLTPPPQFSILNDAAAAGINPQTGENIAGPGNAAAFTSVMGRDAFVPGTNFHDATNPEFQNGIVFFPGSTPLYKDGVLVGGFGVSGDGVDQDDVVTFLAAQGFLPNQTTVAKADTVIVDGVRLPFQKFNRNPFGV